MRPEPADAGTTVSEPARPTGPEATRPEAGEPDLTGAGPAPTGPESTGPEATGPVRPEQAEPTGRRLAGLSERDRGVLAMERRSWPGPGAKERAVREQLGISPVRYYQLLNALLDDERALAHDPVTVNRLRRVRDAKRGRR
ncbi:DUF3263 domain-containing protein [Streptomyces sp. NPDC051018]|uniref:DUF3263 domain-containing protein n=1 Tax=Streptomyces sp. NPDC051018 TaxID=3365639 RepID=UPI00379E694E